jgi:hypothetical protein
MDLKNFLTLIPLSKEHLSINLGHKIAARRNPGVIDLPSLYLLSVFLNDSS